MDGSLAGGSICWDFGDWAPVEEDDLGEDVDFSLIAQEGKEENFS